MYTVIIYQSRENEKFSSIKNLNIQVLAINYVASSG